MPTVQLTIPEFFERLIVLTREAGIEETFGGHLQNRLDLWLIANLVTLRQLALSDPEFWPYQRSTRQSLWKSTKVQLERAGVFAEFKGDTELKKELELFLGLERAR